MPRRAPVILGNRESRRLICGDRWARVVNACGPAATEGCGTVRTAHPDWPVPEHQRAQPGWTSPHGCRTRQGVKRGAAGSQLVLALGAADKMTDDTYVPKSPLACRSSKRCTCRFLCAGDPATEYSLSLNSRPIIRSTICSERVRK